MLTTFLQGDPNYDFDPTDIDNRIVVEVITP